MCSRAKQRYYAAIVREAAARRAQEEIPSGQEVSTVEECTYEDIGRKSLSAFTNLLDVLSGSKGPVRTVDTSTQDTQLKEQLDLVSAQLDSLRRDLGAFTSRIDRVLLDLLRRMEAQEAITSATLAPVSIPVALSGDMTPRMGKEKKSKGAYQRVPKEQTRQKILEAAHQLQLEGKKVTLAECARKAGVAYYKAVYACKESHELEQIING